MVICYDHVVEVNTDRQQVHWNAYYSILYHALGRMTIILLCWYQFLSILYPVITLPHPLLLSFCMYYASIGKIQKKSFWRYCILAWKHRATLCAIQSLLLRIVVTCKIFSCIKLIRTHFSPLFFWALIIICDTHRAHCIYSNSYVYMYMYYYNNYFEMTSFSVAICMK